MRKICITISNEAQGFSKNATLIASIVRRTKSNIKVHLRKIFKSGSFIKFGANQIAYA